MVNVSDDSSGHAGTGDADFGLDNNQIVRQGSPFGGGFYTGAHSPYPIKPGTKPVDAVEYIEPARTDNYSTGFVQHKPLHEQYAIYLNGVNLLDVIAGLTDRITALENPTP